LSTSISLETLRKSFREARTKVEICALYPDIRLIRHGFEEMLHLLFDKKELFPPP
jgi:hypothetical protein